jgi:hypothetical protein
MTETPIVETPKAAAIATGCLPCSMGHFGTASGLMQETTRFSHGPDGIASPEVIDRINMSLDEFNALERVDLRPEMIVQLSGWEKELAQRALTESRAARHKLENIHTSEELEEVAAHIQTVRKEIGKEWFQNKLKALSPEDKEEINHKLLQKLNEMGSDEDN